MSKLLRPRGGRHVRATELALLRRTRGGTVLLAAWWSLLGLAVIGAAALVPFVLRGQHAGSVQLSGRDGVVAVCVGIALMGLCARIAGLRALVGIAGLVLGVGLMLVAARPAIAAGADAALTAWVVALLMAFITLGLTYGRRAVAVAGTVSMAVSLAAATALAAWVVPIVAPGEPLLVAVAVLAAFGGLCDVAITQVSTVVVAARRVGGDGRGRLREIRRDSMHVGADHLTSMIHTLGFATLSGPALGLSERPDGLGPDVIVALVGAVGIALATWVVTQLASWAIGGLTANALTGLHADDHEH